MKQVNVAILGCGTVGTGVARLLLDNGDIIRDRIGCALHLKYVADIDMDRARGLDLAPGVMIPDAAAAIADPDVHIVVETIGGEGIAKKLIMGAIAGGKHVVTANKALLAKHGNAIIEAATARRVDLAYEASVGGCMPIIKAVRESLVGNRISGMTGILNGTCNYILSKITDEGVDFKTALAEAQAKGYAEADPTLDVGGYDAAHKLAILSALAFGMKINFDDVFIEGISRITPLDIEFAAQFGYRIKLLAIAKFDGESVEARVHPTMIPFDNLLSNVNSTLNAISIKADAVDEILLYGHGAGMMPTASAIVSDLADIARNLASDGAGRIPVMGFQADTIRSIPVMSMDDIVTNYYFRFDALDRPGVLAAISGILGKYAISLKSVHQKGRKANGSVPVVMLTHQAREADVSKALAEISVLDVMVGAPMLIRIEDQNGQD
ncbi:homoserine dehydrogenase [Desulfosarcina ovata]|uniref:Homoserine dehydrogenase n=1 Tax=Desulfosarcina ovata subsp. ovata TaxID=2752305 RepID=A0A5K8AHS7_9BACT|nr:homoserine dehydrogenase [Desulfosarcina ovata]BBO92039.1 homoserine dehydrogenase [Desulfosarcina ovata subsp. ovata]